MYIINVNNCIIDKNRLKKDRTIFTRPLKCNLFLLYMHTVHLLFISVFLITSSNVNHFDEYRLTFLQSGYGLFFLYIIFFCYQLTRQRHKIFTFHVKLTDSIFFLTGLFPIVNLLDIRCKCI